VDEAAEMGGGKAAVTVPWVRQGGGARYLRAVGVVQTWSARGLDRAADGGPHTVSLLSLNYPNQLNYKNRNGFLNLLQKSSFLYAGNLRYYEHFSQLCQHPNLNRIRVKIPAIDSPFEILMTF
jgi:hypothetical protein